MLFVIEYQVEWDGLEAAVAKRLEWAEAKPEGFRYLGEWVWHEGDPPFRGITVCQADDVEALHEFVLHYGPTLKFKIHPATDVASGLKLLTGGD